MRRREREEKRENLSRGRREESKHNYCWSRQKGRGVGVEEGEYNSEREEGGEYNRE